MFKYLILLILIGCGTQETEQKENLIINKIVPFYIESSKVDILLMPHVMEFAGYCERFKTGAQCKENFNKIQSIRLVKSFKEKFVVGKCFSSKNFRKIEILNWEDVDSLTIKTIVMHELGHCVLGNPMPHYDEKEDIMNTYLLPDKTIQEKWPNLLKAMFLRAGGKLFLTEESEVATMTHTTMDESGGISCAEEN